MPVIEKPTDLRGKHNNHPSGMKHFAWVEKPSYSALHSWIYRQLGKASKCESCGKLGAKKYEWANLSGEYRRDLSDWRQLCTSCHRKYDYRTRTGWDRVGNPHCLSCGRSDKPAQQIGVCKSCYAREYSRRKRGYYSRYRAAN